MFDFRQILGLLEEDCWVQVPIACLPQLKRGGAVKPCVDCLEDHNCLILCLPESDSRLSPSALEFSELGRSAL